MIGRVVAGVCAWLALATTCAAQGDGCPAGTVAAAIASCEGVLNSPTRLGQALRRARCCEGLERANDDGCFCPESIPAALLPYSLARLPCGLPLRAAPICALLDGDAAAAPGPAPSGSPLLSSVALVLLGDDTVFVAQGDSYVDEGAIGYDPDIGLVTDAIQVTGEVDTSAPGTYEIVYLIEDVDGAETTVTRTVVVEPAPEGEAAAPAPSPAPESCAPLVEALAVCSLGVPASRADLRQCCTAVANVNDAACLCPLSDEDPDEAAEAAVAALGGAPFLADVAGLSAVACGTDLRFGAGCTGAVSEAEGPSPAEEPTDVPGLTVPERCETPVLQLERRCGVRPLSSPLLRQACCAAARELEEEGCLCEPAVALALPSFESVMGFAPLGCGFRARHTPSECEEAGEDGALPPEEAPAQAPVAPSPAQAPAPAQAQAPTPAPTPSAAESSACGDALGDATAKCDASRELYADAEARPEVGNRTAAAEAWFSCCEALEEAAEARCFCEPNQFSLPEVRAPLVTARLVCKLDTRSPCDAADPFDAMRERCTAERAQFAGTLENETVSADAAECCQLCSEAPECTIWSFCGSLRGCGPAQARHEYGACLLKSIPPEADTRVVSGVVVLTPRVVGVRGVGPWISGWDPERAAAAA